MHEPCEHDEETTFLEITHTPTSMTIYSDMDKDTLREARRLLDQMILNTPAETIH